MDEKDLDLNKIIEEVQEKQEQEKKEKEQQDSKKESKKVKKDKFELLKEENHELKEKYLKSVAELENYKKRINEEKIRDRKYASTNLIHDLLLPLDQLKKVVSMNVDDEKLKNFLVGFKMINDNIYNVLIEEGLTEIEALNKQFDPNFHYAVEKISNPELENGIITKVDQIGYMFKDRLLRPAMVQVNEWSEKENE